MESGGFLLKTRCSPLDLLEESLKNTDGVRTVLHGLIELCGLVTKNVSSQMVMFPGKFKQKRTLNPMLQDLCSSRQGRRPLASSTSRKRMQIIFWVTQKAAEDAAVGTQGWADSRN